MSYFGVAVLPPRISEIWPLVKTRLSSATMQTILGGANRVKLVTDSMAPEGVETAAWGRIVIAPVQRFFGQPAEESDRGQLVPWIVRAEAHSPGGGYNPAVTLEAAQAEAFKLLHGWLPSGLSYARAERLVYRERPPQAFSSWDETNGLYWTTSEYRIYLLPALPA